MTIDYQALRDAAEAIKIAATPQKLLAFRMKVTPQVVLALLDERERNQQYIKSRDQENEEIALTVGKLRVEREAAKKRIAELEAEPVSQTYKLPSLPSSEVNDAAWKLHNMLTEHGPLNGRQFNNLKGCFYEAFKVAMRNYPVTPDGWVMVPKQVTPEISNAINVVGQRCTCGNCSQRLWDLLLDATQQGVNRG